VSSKQLAHPLTLSSEAEPHFGWVVSGVSGVLDGCGVDGGGVFGDGGPVFGPGLVVVLDRHVLVGSAGDSRRVAEVVDERSPCIVASGAGVEVTLEPGGLVAPASPAGGPTGYWPEDVEVELGGLVGEREDAFDPCHVQGPVELVDVAAEVVPLSCGRGDGRPAGLLVAVEVGQPAAG
jgi:hypothetical protein